MTQIVLLLALLAQQPDRRGEVVLSEPAYRGEKASAPIPPELHIRNEGGSDGAGLCVTSSALANGMYQGVPALKDGKASLFWRTAKSRPGGYSPDKLRRLVEETVPGEPYASYTGTGSAEDQEMLEKLSRAGYPIGATMNTGALYSYAPIHHMVSLVHYRRDGYACVVDNNRPGYYSWMPAAEWNRRWPDMGSAWAWIWTRLPAAVAKRGHEILISALVLATAVVALAARRRMLETEDCERCFP